MAFFFFFPEIINGMRCVDNYENILSMFAVCRILLKILCISTGNTNYDHHHLLFMHS